MAWSPDPAVLAWLAVAEVLYLRARRRLARRGVAVPRGQTVAWHAGLALWLAGLVSPIDPLGEELLSAHMLQHLLIADLAAPLLLTGLRNPVLAFFPPRALLVGVARRRRLRAALRTLRRPLVALPVYVAVLYGWHLGFAFEAAVAHPALHALQHASFVGAGMLVWWSALEPQRRRPRGELWKIGHILAARFLGMFLGMAFVVARAPVYVEAYGAGKRGFGLSALHDQQLAGGLMIVLDILIMVWALAYFFLRASQEDDRREARAGRVEEPPRAGAAAR